MNIVVPKGRIRQLRFHVQLEEDASGHVEVIDGLAHNQVEDKAIASGTVTLSLAEGLRFATAAAPAVTVPGNPPVKALRSAIRGDSR